MKRVFEPIRIGREKLEIPNRFAATAAVTLTCDKNGYPTEHFISYYEGKAKGGWGLIFIEDTAVDKYGRSFDRVPGLWEDGQGEAMKGLTRRVHKFGSRIFAQIYHAGRQTKPDVIDGECTIAPSRIIDPNTRATPRAMSVREIEEMVVKFGEAAYRAKQAGFDGVEVHAGHGYLVNEFLSHYSNKRVDKYGGNIRNRCRFALEILQEIKKRCGDGFPVSMRISADEKVPGGITIEDAKVIAMLLEENGLDLMNVSAAVNASVQYVTPPAAVRHGVYVDLAEEIKQVVSIPVIGVGRVNDPFLAEAVLESGKCDLVGMLRASMADPELPNKAKEGRFEDIKTCVGCLIGCSGHLAKGISATCIFNPVMTRETEIPVKEAEIKKSVAVIGAGVGGMEFAITAARCGHEVTLIEKENIPGGQYRYAAVPPEKGELTSFLVWQQTQLKKLGVRMLMNTEATASLIETLRPDVAVVAAGAKPVFPPIPGVKGPQVFTAIQVLAGEVLPGKKGIVIGGGMVGGETAYHLSSHGYQVQAIIEMLPEILGDMPRNPKIYLNKALKEAGIDILTETVVKEIAEGMVVIEADGRQQEIQTDFVVIATGSKSCGQLAEELQGKVEKVLCLGDAKQPRSALEAIHEGYELAVNL